MSKRALGKGIDALFRESPGAQPGQDAGSSVLSIPLDRIDASAGQPRRDFDDASIRELAESIKRSGVLQPIIVSPTEGGRYLLVAGERRWRAARAAGKAEIPAMVRRLDERERLEVALVENLQREDLDPIEEAQGYRRLMELSRVSQDEIARALGKDRSTIANSVRLLKLAPEVQEAVARGELSAGHARAILSVVNPADQKALVERVLGQGLSVRQTEEEAAGLNQGARASGRRKSASGGRRDSALQAVEKELFDRLGTKVEIKGDRKRGRIEISYFSAEDLDRIVEILTHD